MGGGPRGGGRKPPPAPPEDAELLSVHHCSPALGNAASSPPSDSPTPPTPSRGGGGYVTLRRTVGGAYVTDRPSPAGHPLWPWTRGRASHTRACAGGPQLCRRLERGWPGSVGRQRLHEVSNASPRRSPAVRGPGAAIWTRDVLEGGGGGGGWPDPPPPMVPAEGGPKILKLKSEGAKAKCWLSASNIGRGGRGGEWGFGRIPPPPPPRVPLWSRGPKILELKSSRHQRRRGKIPFPSAVHLEERLTVSQSVS